MAGNLPGFEEASRALFAFERRRFGELRKRRTREGQKFLDGLVARGYIRRLGYKDEFALLTTNTWLLTNHWLNFVESTG